MTHYAEIIARLRPGAALRVDLLVLPGASLMTCASAVEPLRAANRVAAAPVFDWRLLSPDGAAPVCSAGLALPVSGAFRPEAPRDILAVIAGFRAREIADRTLLRGIFRAARAAALTLGIEAGPWLLARAGLLDGRRATTHWEDLEDFAAAFPLVELRGDRVAADGAVVTASGASPAFDLMIDLIRHRAGQGVALAAAGVFNHDIAHPLDDRQSPVAFGHDGRFGARFDARVVHAVSLMQATIDRPLAVAAIAARARMSPRGFEQLFAREIGQTPGRYYLSLRLGAARKMVRDTRLPMVEIAARSGFASSAAFSRAYRIGFGRAPSIDRRTALGRTAT